MSDKIKILFGTAAIARWSKEDRNEFFNILESYNVKDLDTAVLYPGSEATLGEIGAPAKFTIHTKAPGFGPGVLKKEAVLSAAQKSIKDLGVESVETYFLHSPDPETPIEETLDAIQEVYKSGKFKHVFRTIKFQARRVQKVYDYASSKGYVLPTVYQGNYNAVARHSEPTIFPLLRKLGIRFYAYSPIAGGFLVKSPDTVTGSKGRFDKDSFIGQLYQKLYNKPSLLKALIEWEDISKDSGISKVALAYRWTAYNSELDPKIGDGIIIGASRPAQLKQTLDALKEGPLDSRIVDRIQKVWETVKDEAPLDNFNSANL